MRQVQVTCWFVVLAIANSHCSPADEKVDAANFKALRRDLAKRLPSGWELKADFKIGATVADPPRPRIVIRSKKRLTVEFIPPSSPPGPAPAKQEIVEIELVVQRYLSPREFTRLKAENVKRIRQRYEFCAKHFVDLRFRDTKGGQLYAPNLLKPKTDEQRRRLLEYSFLWLKTVPHDLPSHRYVSLSFTVFELPYLVMREERANYGKLIDAINNVLTPYEKQTKHSDDRNAPPAPPR